MTDPNAPHGTADDLERQQVEEWSRYRARVAINFYGQRAYNRGDPVPISAVDGPAAWVSQDFVEAQGDTPFAGSATVPPPEPPTVDDANVGAPPVSSPDPGSIVTSSEG